MKPYKYIGIICIFAIITSLISACSKEDYQLSEEGKTVSLTFRPTLDEELNTRVIGDATSINTLVVTVYEERADETLSKKFDIEKDWQEAKDKGVDLTLTLIEGHTYKILFWAQNDNNGAYEITDDGKIDVNYDDYIDGGFAKMEEMDAFYGVSDITVDSTPTKNKTITLTRPLAQLNFADNTTQPTSTHSVEVTISNIPTSFNPFNDEVTTGDEVITFSFTDFPSEPLVIDGSDYYYLSCNYLFVPTSNVSATLKLKQNSETVEELSIDNITLEKNKKTNVIGAIVQQPETWSVWDGEAKSQPAIDVQNRYIIDEAADIAWLSENGATLTSNSIFLQTKDIDMASRAITSIKLPAGSTYDGGGKTIKNYKNSLFGDATSLSVQNLIVDEITASSTTHVGVLVNTLKGSANFSNVTVTNSSATTNYGAAGGMVGYIVRTTEKDRNEKLNVSFNGCKLNKISVSGSASEGKFIGLLSGYDNNEALSFDSECEAANVSVADYTSVYTKTNNSVWVTGDVTNKYDGWLGHETYRRAKVTFAGVRMAPRWDGTTIIAPLTDGTTKLIYSAFDLASLQEATGAQITFKSDVDMGAKVFEPIMTANKVYGKRDDNDDNYVIYNLKVDTYFLSGPWYGGAFIRKMASGSVENITIKDANVSVKNAEGYEDAYASILVATIEGENVTVKNVRIDGGYLKGINKIGGIAGYVSCNLQATNCIVSGLTIENFTTSNTGDVFESYGEIGGLIGFIQGNGSVISQCQVNKSTLNVKASLLRYNNRFIGTANPSSGQKITIETNCSATGNSVTNENRLKYGGFFGIGGKTFDLLGGYSLSVAQGGAVYYGTTKLK